jgi:hypothetical protein
MGEVCGLLSQVGEVVGEAAIRWASLTQIGPNLRPGPVRDGEVSGWVGLSFGVVGRVSAALTGSLGC